MPVTSAVDENPDQHQPKESFDEVDDTDPSKLTLDVSNKDPTDETVVTKETVDSEVTDDTIANTDAGETAQDEETDATTDMVVEATKTVDSGDELSETCEQVVETESIKLNAVNKNEDKDS